MVEKPLDAAQRLLSGEIWWRGAIIAKVDTTTLVAV
jgi:hypothetical protein